MLDKPGGTFNIDGTGLHPNNSSNKALAAKRSKTMPTIMSTFFGMAAWRLHSKDSDRKSDVIILNEHSSRVNSIHIMLLCLPRVTRCITYSLPKLRGGMSNTVKFNLGRRLTRYQFDE